MVYSPAFRVLIYYALLIFCCLHLFCVVYKICIMLIPLVTEDTMYYTSWCISYPAWCYLDFNIFCLLVDYISRLVLLRILTTYASWWIIQSLEFELNCPILVLSLSKPMEASSGTCCPLGGSNTYKYAFYKDGSRPHFTLGRISGAPYSRSAR